MTECNLDKPLFWAGMQTHPCLNDQATDTEEQIQMALKLSAAVNTNRAALVRCYQFRLVADIQQFRAGAVFLKRPEF